MTCDVAEAGRAGRPASPSPRRPRRTARAGRVAGRRRARQRQHGGAHEVDRLRTAAPRTPPGSSRASARLSSLSSSAPDSSVRAGRRDLAAGERSQCLDRSRSPEASTRTRSCARPAGRASQAPADGVADPAARPAAPVRAWSSGARPACDRAAPPAAETARPGPPSQGRAATSDAGRDGPRSSSRRTAYAVPRRARPVDRLPARPTGRPGPRGPAHGVRRLGGSAPAASRLGQLDPRADPLRRMVHVGRRAAVRLAVGCGIAVLDPLRRHRPPRRAA